MRVAIGSSSTTEIGAVKEAWKVFSASLSHDAQEKAEFLGYGVAGRPSQMPMSVMELMSASQERVETLILQLKRERTEADFYVGLESGFNVVDSQGPRRIAFLESWAYVSDGHRGRFGHGGGIVVPPGIADPVIDRGIDLSIVLDRFSGEREISSEKGLWGILTKDILSAQHAFVVALIAAFAPFYNFRTYD
jgi:non-canonical (house-cleaning) NTP pyrophosphatase